MLLPFANVNIRTPSNKLCGASTKISPKLSDYDEYIIALDQSTTRTGMAIGKRYQGIVAILEIESRTYRRQDYIHELYLYLRNILRGKKVIAILLEDVFEGTDPKTFKLLQELRNTLLTLKKNGVTGRIERINNMAWKSEYFKDIKESNMFTRENSKRLSREVSLKLYPWSDGLIEDGYDATGILHSYMSACFDLDWTFKTPRMINKFIYSEGRHFYEYAIIPNNKSHKLIDDNISKFETEVMRYNPDLTPQENGMLATAISNKLVITEPIPQCSWYSIFCMQNKVLWENDTKFRMAAISTNKRGNYFNV